MKILSKHQCIERKNSDKCIVTEYPHIDDEIDFAIVEITGRYPHSGRATNLKCKEIVYVSSGSGKVIVDDEEQLLNTGDVVLIEAGEKFSWEGNMRLFISCHPAFTIEQHQHID